MIKFTITTDCQSCQSLSFIYSIELWFIEYTKWDSAAVIWEIGEWLGAWWKCCSLFVRGWCYLFNQFLWHCHPTITPPGVPDKIKKKKKESKYHAGLHSFIVCFLSRLFMFVSPRLFILGCEIHTHSTLQRTGRGHTSHFHERICAEGPGRMKRLTKGVSISLPSSPILPRQADIVPAHSCSRFTGGLKFKQCGGDVQMAHSPHCEQLGRRRCGTWGNSCRDNGTLSCLRLD